jgi:hypothetical protein
MNNPSEKLIVRRPEVHRFLSGYYVRQFDRRHPYYLQHGRAASRQGTPPLTPPEQAARVEGVRVLKRALGVSGVGGYPDPACVQLADNTTSNAQPATVASVFHQHFLNLPIEVRKWLAAILLDVIPDDGLDVAEDSPEQKLYERRLRAAEWLGAAFPLLHKPIARLIALDPAVSERAIRDDLDRLIRTARGGAIDFVLSLPGDSVSLLPDLPDVLPSVSSVCTLWGPAANGSASSGALQTVADRVASYVARVPHRGEGEGRDDLAYRLACWLNTHIPHPLATSGCRGRSTKYAYGWMH